MENEILLVDKPEGMSSFGVVARVRRKLSEQAGMVSVQRRDGTTVQKRKKVKVGHTGTLDPFATGLLILLIGKGTKKANEFLKLDKEYVATACLGSISTTGDYEGERLELVASSSLTDALLSRRTISTSSSVAPVASNKLTTSGLSPGVGPDDADAVSDMVVNSSVAPVASNKLTTSGLSGDMDINQESTYLALNEDVDNFTVSSYSSSVSNDVDANIETDNFATSSSLTGNAKKEKMRDGAVDELTDERFAVAMPEQLATKIPNKMAVEKCVQNLVGENWQRVPNYSAVKINGQRAYKLAREGKQVEMPVRRVQIYEMEVLDYEWPVLKFRCKVSSGTYIRTLAEDIGKALGTGAYLTALRRTQVGNYRIEDAQTLQGLGIE